MGLQSLQPLQISDCLEGLLRAKEKPTHVEARAGLICNPKVTEVICLRSNWLRALSPKIKGIRAELHSLWPLQLDLRHARFENPNCTRFGTAFAKS
jgi:hypothetical protein